jgi:NADH-quinone oxidoreductase subunit J
VSGLNVVLAAAAHVDGPAWAVYSVGLVMILAGAFGVVLMRNPVHSALMLVVTLFGIALEFIDEAASFLAAVQVIVYAGAIVILFLFVIMFLGVDRKETFGRERFRAQKPLAVGVGLAVVAELVLLARVRHWASGFHSVAGTLSGSGTDVQKLGQSVYTRYLLPFEMTSALLVIAVVATVVLARQRGRAASEMSKSEQQALRGDGADAGPQPPGVPAGQRLEEAEGQRQEEVGS